MYLFSQNTIFYWCRTSLSL